jgi:outer membrane biosynthesis protein TonB
MTPKGLAVMTGALWCFGLLHQAQALAPDPCHKSPAFVPLQPIGTVPNYSDALYSIGANNSYAMPKCAPVINETKKASLLLVPPVQREVAEAQMEVAALIPEPEMETSFPEQDLPVTDPTSVVTPVPRPALPEISEPQSVPEPAPAPVTVSQPAPAPRPVQEKAEPPTQTSVDDDGYSEPSLAAPALIGLGTAAVMTYLIWDATDDKNGEPARLAASSEPVQALVAYDTKMLASFAAVNTVADLQSDQQISVGVSSSLYDETSAFAAGMSLRLGTRGIFKTAVSFSDSEYLANAGLSYGW